MDDELERKLKEEEILLSGIKWLPKESKSENESVENKKDNDITDKDNLM